ncbi:MAG: lytic transglycosylase domain-containing protein [Bdellovibrionota bacterium]
MKNISESKVKHIVILAISLALLNYAVGKFSKYNKQKMSAAQPAIISSDEGLNEGISPSKSEAPSIKKIKGVSELEEPSRYFLDITSQTEMNYECLPIVVEKKPKYDIDFLHCSDAALEQDGKSIELTKNFRVTEMLARRYNFWRRVYSHFSSNQYLLHLAEYPEVVLEIYDLSKVSDLDYHQKRKLVRKISQKRKYYYRKLFKKLHKHRNDDLNSFSPDMQRIARLMGHISNKKKYRIASLSIRTQTGQRNYIEKGLTQASKYISAIESEFKKVGIPSEISRLAFVESSFNLQAHSKAGASGVFQIMPSTGHQYLKIKTGIDERNDPIKAARAAAKLLQLNYKITKRWPLAITAYNHGVGSIKRAVKKTGSYEIDVIIDRYNHNSFGFASKNFYAEFLAMLGTLHEAHLLFPGNLRYDPLAFDTVKLPRTYSMHTIRKKYGVTNQQIEELNPDISDWYIKRGGVLPKGFDLKVPVEKESDISLSKS